MFLRKIVIMTKIGLFTHAFFFCAALTLVSCDESAMNEVSNKEQFDLSLDEANQNADANDLTHELGTVRKNIEQAANLYKRLYSAECPFNSNLVSDVFPSFNTSRVKALAMGKYASMFVYTASYEQTQYANSYLTEVLSISSELGIRDAFNEDQLRMLYDPDPAIDKSAVLTKAYLKATELMYSEEKALLVSYMVLGGWLQGMKLSYEVCGNYLTDKNVALNLYDQTYSYYNCVRLLNESKDKMDSPAVYIKSLDTISPEIELLVKSRGNIDTELFDQLRKKILVLENEINSHN